MRRVAGVVLIVGLVLAAFSTNELLQRVRFNRQAGKISAALEEFARTPLEADRIGGVWKAGKATEHRGRLDVEPSSVEEHWSLRCSGWSSSAHFDLPDMTMGVRMPMVVLVQNRTLFLLSPHVHVLGKLDPSLQQTFDDAFKAQGLTYSTTYPFNRN